MVRRQQGFRPNPPFGAWRHPFRRHPCCFRNTTPGLPAPAMTEHRDSCPHPRRCHEAKRTLGRGVAGLCPAGRGSAWAMLPRHQGFRPTSRSEPGDFPRRDIRARGTTPGLPAPAMTEHRDSCVPRPGTNPPRTPRNLRALRASVFHSAASRYSSRASGSHFFRFRMRVSSLGWVEAYSGTVGPSRCSAMRCQSATAASGS